MGIDPLILTTTSLPREVLVIAEALKVASPPSMVRLEPDSITGDPTPGSEARLADPAWLLGRQWQFGELIGENAGSVVSVGVRSQALPVTAWAPLPPDDDRLDAVVWRPWREGALLEELVQDVSDRGFGDGVRQRARAGAQLADVLRDAGADAAADALAERYPLGPGVEALDAVGARLLSVLGGSVADGRVVLADLDAAEPAWVAADQDPAAVRDALMRWREWLVGDPDSGGAWSTERLEYRFALRFGDDEDAVFARGTQFGSASVRWSDLEWVPGLRAVLPVDAPSGAPLVTDATMLATPLRYPGMPADRYWQLEDGRVDLSVIEAQPTDLARLCLAEFAMTSGDDWLGVPVDGLLGAINRVERVVLTDDFGDEVEVAELADPAFTMFRMSAREGGSSPGVVLPPVAADILVGEPLEEVLFLRDEMANMAWAIELTVQGASGDPRPRGSEPLPPPDPWPEGLTEEERVYRLQTPVPAHWIPLVPVALRPGQISLRKGALLRGDAPVLPVGVTLEPTPLTFPGEEIPREGVALGAVPALARRANGRYVTWVAYRMRTGRGEASSRLAWDAALSKADGR